MSLPVSAFAASPQLLRPRIFADDPRIAAGHTLRSAGTMRHVAGGQEQPGNFQAVAAAIGWPHRDTWALAHQVHGTRVTVVDSPGCSDECDGLVTRSPGLFLGIMTADCAAVLLADAEATTVGACHAGWRGAVGDVLPATIDAMVAQGARPGRLRAYISPCISLEAFECGEEVADQFPEAHVHRSTVWGPKPHADIAGLLVDQLRAAGVTQIEAAGQCTVAGARAGRLFSHRADTPGSNGRMLSFIGLVT